MSAKKRSNRPCLISVHVPTVQDRLKDVRGAVNLTSAVVRSLNSCEDQQAVIAMKRILLDAENHLYYLLKNLPEDVLAVNAPDDDQRDAMEQAGGDREIVRMRLETVERAGA